MAMARLLARALILAIRSPFPPPPPISACLFLRLPLLAPSTSLSLSPLPSSSRGISSLPRASRSPRSLAPVRRRIARRPVSRRRVKRVKPLQLDVQICIEEELPDDPHILSIAEELKKDVPNAMKVAFDNLKISNYKTRDNSIESVDPYQKVELSVLLCNDDFIRELNKDWRDEDSVTDVLSMSQHIPELDIPILLLGDIVISVQTAARQAEEREHTLLDEIRILMVHGLLHLLGFDHEISTEAEQEMGREEERILKSLGWREKGLIQIAYDSIRDESHMDEHSIENSQKLEKSSNIEAHGPRLNYILFNIDGQVETSSVETLGDAVSKGVKTLIVTGKSRPAISKVLEMINLGEHVSSGVFLQGALVYGRQGREIYRANLDPDFCREAFSYSLGHEIPIIAFSGDQCFTLFEHAFVDSLHTVYHEPKAEVVTSVEQIMANSNVQKLVFLETPKRVSSVLRPYWSEATEGRARIIQTQPDMLEIIPLGCSKSISVKLLLDHLGITEPDEFEIGGDCLKWLGHLDASYQAD